ICATKCLGSSRCIVRLHSCTAGFFISGSKAPTLGAVPEGCGATVRALEGVVVGSGMALGNPEEMRPAKPDGVEQPTDVPIAPLESIVLLQSSMKPGTFPAIAVTWNVDSVSNSKAYPARTAVLGSGDQETPMRGPSAPMLLFLNHRSAFTKATAPCEPSMGRFGTRACVAS